MHMHLGSRENILDGTMRQGRPTEKVSDFFVDTVRKLAGFPPIKDYKLMYRLHLDGKKIYDLARRRGMDYLAITDHDEITPAIQFLSEYPELEKRVIVGEEITTRLKDRGYVIHVGVWGINEDQHQMIQKASGNLEGELLPYLEEQKLVYALNHPFAVPWTRRGAKMTQGDLERLKELFPLAEKRNGNILKEENLLAEKYFIDQGATAGGDSHMGDVGRTWVEAPGETKEDFLDSIRRGLGTVGGKHHSILSFIGEIADKPLNYGGVLYFDEGLRPEQIPQHQKQVARFGQRVFIDGRGEVITEIPVVKGFRALEKFIAGFIVATSPLWAVYRQFMDNGVEKFYKK